jgi:hypothetical protein
MATALIPFAHVLAPLTAPAWLEWAVSLGLAGGMCLVFLTGAWWRLCGAALCLAAATAGLSLVVIGRGPSRPDLRPVLVVAARAASPVVVRACARTAGGAAVALPGPGRVLGLRVDGAPAGTETSPRFALELAPGEHRVEVEVLTSAHREFSPPLLATTTVRVVPGTGALAAAACPG